MRLDRDIVGIAMATLNPRPELPAYSQAMRSPLPEVVRALTELLGARLVAYIGGVSEARAVRQWATGVRMVRNPAVEPRLRLALQVASMLCEGEGNPAVAQAWFQGLNPQLEDRVPVQLLREGDMVADGPALLDAARAFLSGG